MSTLDVPDTSSSEALVAWGRAVLERATLLQASVAVLTSLRAWELPRESERNALGLLGTATGRRFINALWAADWATYETEDDRVDYLRLAFVVNLFARGFTLFTVQHPDGTTLPVGYTGWYPIGASTHELLTRTPEQLVHRGQVVPVPSLGAGQVQYIFNYSIAAPLRRTVASRSLLHSLRTRLEEAPGSARCAIVVSDDGKRVARRFGMQERATITVGSSTEWVYSTASP